MLSKAKFLLVVHIAIFASIPIFGIDKEIKILMVLWRGFTEAERGFQEKIEELGYSPKYTIINGNHDIYVLTNKLKSDVKPNITDYDYIYSFGTTATSITQMVTNGKIPHIFNIVADPVKAGIAKSIISAGRNISGVSPYISVESQVTTALKVIKIETLGFLYNPREENTKIILNELRQIAKQMGFEIIEIRTAPDLESLESLLDRISNMSNKMDAIYLPLDSFLISNAQAISRSLKSSGLPSICAQKEYIDTGGLMGLVPDYYKLGQVAALTLYRSEKGEKLENIPVFTDENPQIVVNSKTMDFFKLKIPSELSIHVVYVK